MSAPPAALTAPALPAWVPPPLIPTPLLTICDEPGHCDGCGVHDPRVDDRDRTVCCEGLVCYGGDCQHRATCRTCDAAAVEFAEGAGWVCANLGH